MTIFQMFGQSSILSLLGMAVVFAFLIIMIFTVELVAKLVKSMGWDTDIQPKAFVSAAAPVSSANDAGVVAAITAAVTEHRKSN